MLKEGFVQKSGAPAEGEMEEINRYTRREYKPEEVYAFSLTLCDNEVDRDYERFSIPALEKLRELFLGKTCILDHERKSMNQTARIYHTGLEPEEGRVTQAGEPYTRLTARAYLPRTERTKETMELIESGILKEVSVSCSVRRSVCSICGKESCSHQKGKEYGGKLCSRILEDPADAYECSFVAVPAQREAGVRKNWKQGEPLEKRLRRAGPEGVSLTAEEARRLGDRLDELTEKAGWGESFRQALEAQVLKYSGLLQPQLPRDVMKSAVSGLSLSELSRLGKAYEAMAEKALPLKPQLAPERREEKEGSNGDFRI